MRQKIGVSLILAAVVPLAVASTAWACGVLATLTFNTQVASPGQTLTATGVNYSNANAFGPVNIRLMTRHGQTLATTSPAAGGGISTPVTLPSKLGSGWYVVLATQYNLATGAPKAGTPGRTTVHVVKGSAARHGAVAGSPWGSSKPPGPSASAASAPHNGGGSSSPALLPMLVAIALSLALLASGMTLAGRRNAPAHRPQLGV